MKKVKYIGPISAGKLCAAVGAVFGLLIVPFGLWGAISGYLAPGTDLTNTQGLIGIVLLCIGLPILYGAVGFVLGIISAFIYNILPNWLGHLEVELEWQDSKNTSS